MIIWLLLCAGVAARGAQDTSGYEGRLVSGVEIVLEGVPANKPLEAELQLLLRVAPDTVYSAASVRETLQEFWESGRVANARVEVSEPNGQAASEGTGPVRVRFIVRPQPRVNEILFDLAPTPLVSEDELRARLNMLEPGARLLNQTLAGNADTIQAYLRDRGFYRAEVEYTTQLDPSGTGATVTFLVRPGAQARVEALNIKIAGFDDAHVRSDLRLQPGAPFTIAALGEDVRRIRQAIIERDHLAPQITSQFQLDSTSNTITVNLTGNVGPKIDVKVSGYDISEKTERELLPITREGTIDPSAIAEGERRLRNRLQENGYFFADVNSICTVTPPLATGSAITGVNNSTEPCEVLNPEELQGRMVNITYQVEPGRRFKLTDIRIEGTDKIPIEEIAGDLRTKKFNALGFIPVLGYGRGYTSEEALGQDRRTIEERMRELGYRKGQVTDVRQGVTLDGENLIITFVVEEGPLTRVAGVGVTGNQIYTAERLREEPCNAARLRGEPCIVTGAPFSRTLARADADRIRNFYSRSGYLEADVQFDIVDLPPQNGDEQVRIIYTVTERDKVLINRIFINGNALTEREAILRAISLREGEVLRADDIAGSERALFATNAFREIVIRTEQAGVTAAGFQKRDVIIELEEQKPRDLTYGFGYSTDNGPLGIFEIRNNNLFGDLRQGAVRVRGSRRQQLVRLEYFDPRFRSYGQGSGGAVGEGQFAPLALSAQYQRDSTVTRFFRSTIDRANSGIVQRFNNSGEPVDVNCLLGGECESVNTPTINRFSINAETQRVINRESRSILFLRYNYEDVRLININSLLVEPLLRPDRAVRLSRLGAAFVRDTREQCLEVDSPRLQSLTANGGSPCQYNQADPTRGDFLTLDYALALRQLGGSISFSKLQTSYRRYYRVNRARGTVLAAGATLGLANLFNPRDRNGNNVIDDTDRTLPISERFFAGGSTTLRGFDYEEAGPRVVLPSLQVIQQGGFFDRNGEPVTINPFAVPIGGNALAVVNLEARIPLTRNFQIVPFYDGGNVFRRVSDIFKRGDEMAADPDLRNLRARWSNTVGLGIRLKTPLGPLGIDYGFLLNPPEFVIPQTGGDPAIYRLKRTQFHLRFRQAF
ncbi:MAG: BamA/TamA family outer membrane protein [Pyrinomonadaceae bacterium]|nr:BamA/TamA family outer membrane protein [Pyrinomonadaceae bacterium]